MPEDLRDRLLFALQTLVVLDGDDRILMAGPVERIADTALKALGDPEVEWSTLCDGHRYTALEHTARYRASGAGHVLECRDVVAGDWHQPEDPDADQASANRTANKGN